MSSVLQSADPRRARRSEARISLSYYISKFLKSIINLTIKHKDIFILAADHCTLSIRRSLALNSTLLGLPFSKIKFIFIIKRKCKDGDFNDGSGAYRKQDGT